MRLLPIATAAWHAAVAAPPRGALPHRRRLLRIVVVGWGLAIAVAAALAGHSAGALVASEIPVICGLWLAHSARVGRRLGAAALSLTLVAVATSSALIVAHDAFAVGIFAAALVLGCWLEDRVAAFAAAVAVLALQATIGPLTLQTGDSGAPSLLILGAVMLAAVGPWRYNAARERELNADRENLAKLVTVSRSVATSDDPRGALIAGLLEFAGAEVATLCELSDDRTSLVVTATSIPEAAGLAFPVAGQPSGVASAFTKGESLFVADTKDHPLIQQAMVELTGVQSILYEPVAIDGRPAGVLMVGWRSFVGTVAVHRRSLVTLAATEAAAAIRRDAVTRDLRAQALTDGLTGALNRRAFDDELASAICAATTHGRPLSLAMLDLNGFKALNDRHGHAAGDHVLRSCVEAWRGVLSGSDVLARLGGDEFAVILPGCDAQGAETIGRRLRAAIDVVGGGVTTGVGTAVWDGHERAESLTRRADRLLYADKAVDPARSRRVTNLEVARTGLVELPTDPELQRLTDTLRHALDAPVAMFSLITDETQHVIAQSGAADVPAVPPHLRTEDSFCLHPTSTGQAFTVDDCAGSSDFADHPATRQGARAYAGVPVVVGDRVYGAVCGIDTAPRAWTADHLAALRMAAHLAALYLSSPAEPAAQSLPRVREG